MAILNESGLRDKIRNCPTGAYLIYGGEDYLKKAYVEKIVAKTVEKDFAEFNFHTFEGKEAKLSEIYDCVEAIPMMSETNCVLVTDMALDNEDTGLSDLFRSMITDMPESCALIFYMQTVNPTGEKWKKVIKLFEDYATVAKLEKKEKADLVRMVEKGGERREAPFDPGVAAYLVECVGMDLNTVVNEMEKLCAYAAGRTVKRSDVDAVCIKSLEAKAFDIMKALHAGRFDTAMDKLAGVLAQREEPTMLLGAFIASYVDMYRARAAVLSSRKAEEVATVYDYKKKEFRLTNGARDSRGMSLQALYRCIEVLAEADDLLKSSVTDQGLVLEQTLARLAVIEGEK